MQNRTLLLHLFLSLSCVIITHIAFAQKATQITEKKIQMITYPFSDPDPLPSPQKLYPYFRFDGFSNTSIKKEWKVITLENEFIRVEILPEIGGKIWSAYDKINKRDYIYNNSVVKFRDISMRGPWTSGGIEANYGIIGHTPNTSTPVDYLLKSNSDSSASCFIHTLDLISRTRWTLEVKLEKDKGYFSTKSFWSNTNPVEQTYYTWMNLGVPTSDDLQFIYPGNKYIGHDGKDFNWPIDAQGNNLANYSENAFGGSKSYHVLGAPSNIFGAYYKASDQGMIRYALRDDKLGKKIFLWAQSGSGKIWENLLTDHSGQYAEIQSGRLFNQNAFTSSATAFKQISFQPYQSDRWEEYWMPFKAIGKPTAINLIAAFHIVQNGNKLDIKIDPKQSIQDSLKIFDSNLNLLATTFINGNIGQVVNAEMILGNNAKPQFIFLKGQQIDLELDSQQLNRPTSSDNPQKELDSLIFLGRDLLRFHLFAEAEPVIQKSQILAPHNLEVYLNLIKLHWFRMEYKKAFEFATKALTMDSYDPEINYYYGLLSSKLNRPYDAMDGFQVASLSSAWRSPSWTELSKLSIKKKDFQQALIYARKALRNEQDNIEAYQLLQLSSVATLSQKEELEAVETLNKIDPLNPFNTFEKYWKTKTQDDKLKFINHIQQELRLEAFLELAIWYHSVGYTDKARSILEFAPQNIESLYWLAWLNKDNSSTTKWIQLAEESPLDFVFPFREESNIVLQWVAENHSHWKQSYLQALLYKNRNQPEKALQLLLKNQDETIRFAPYFAVLSQLMEKESLSMAINYMKQAAQIAPEEWRYGKLLSNLYRLNKNYSEAELIAGKYFKANPKNYIVGMNYCRMLLLQGKYEATEKVLSTIQILPFEGATDGHRYFEQTKLMLAFEAINKRNNKLAEKKIYESKLWPMNLGVGEPYQSEKQEILANWLAYELYKNRDPEKAKNLLINISKTKSPNHKALVFIQSEANRLLGNIEIANLLKQETLSSSSTNEKALLHQIQTDAIETYWPKLVSNVYQGEDQRLF